MNRFVFILLTMFPILGFGQSNFFWSHNTSVYYEGNTASRYEECDSFLEDYFPINNFVFHTDYIGNSPDSIQIISIDKDYDGDGISLFYLLENNDNIGDPEVSLPFTVGFLSNDNPDSNVNIAFDNYVDSSYVLCSDSPQRCAIEFRIKDTNGIWGPSKLFIRSYIKQFV